MNAHVPSVVRRHAAPVLAALFVVVGIASLVGHARDTSHVLDALVRGTHALDRAALEDAVAFVDAAMVRAVDASAPRGERLRALSVIAAAKRPDLDDTVRALRGDADPEVRRVARQVLLVRASRPARRALLDEMRADPDPRVREIAVDLLSRDGDVTSLRAVAQNDADPTVQRRAARRLALLARDTQKASVGDVDETAPPDALSP